MTTAADLYKMFEEIFTIYNHDHIYFNRKKVDSIVDKYYGFSKDKFDTSSIQALVDSIIRNCNVKKPFMKKVIVETRCPVYIEWHDHDKFKPKKDNALIIVSCPCNNDFNKKTIRRWKQYADQNDLDLILVSGHTQGWHTLEIFRIKKIVEQYQRSIIISNPAIPIKTNHNLLSIVPPGYVGCSDLSILLDNLSDDKRHLERWLREKEVLYRADAFHKFLMIDTKARNYITNALTYIPTILDFSICTIDKEHAVILDPILFPSRWTPLQHYYWMELQCYKYDIPTYFLPEDYNVKVWLPENKDKNKSIIVYDFIPYGTNVRHTYVDSNNFVGYKEQYIKENKDISINIVCMLHSNKQAEHIPNVEELTLINLNEISNLGNEWAEGRIFDGGKAYVLKEDADVCGIVTGSWNMKYVGLNPIHEIRKWPVISELYKHTNYIACADTLEADLFWEGRGRPPVLSTILNISKQQIIELLDLLELEPKRYIHSAISNNVIARRDVLEQLFEYYEKNDILYKLDKFFTDNKLVGIRDRRHVERPKAYLVEFTTFMWVANMKDVILCPQEILRRDWYKPLPIKEKQNAKHV